MDITTNEDWQWADDEYEVAFATTSDPRVLAVIKREDEWGGDHIQDEGAAPAFYFDPEPTPAGTTFMDDASQSIAQRYLEARVFVVNARYGPGSQRLRAVWRDADEFVRRYLRIFHGTVFDRVRSTIDQGTEAVIFSTPTWREHIGGVAGDELRVDALGGDVEEWEAALSGNVFGVGWATNVGRVMDDGETPNPTEDPWTMSIECWGFLGEEYAKREALEFWKLGEPPHLEPLLDFDEPGFVEHSDRMADAS